MPPFTNAASRSKTQRAVFHERRMKHAFRGQTGLPAKAVIGIPLRAPASKAGVPILPCFRRLGLRPLPAFRQEDRKIVEPGLQTGTIRQIMAVGEGHGSDLQTCRWIPYVHTPYPFMSGWGSKWRLIRALPWAVLRTGCS